MHTDDVNLKKRVPELDIKTSYKTVFRLICKIFIASKLKILNSAILSFVSLIGYLVLDYFLK